MDINLLYKTVMENIVNKAQQKQKNKKNIQVNWIIIIEKTKKYDII